MPGPLLPIAITGTIEAHQGSNTEAHVPDQTAQITREIEVLHDFIAAWFRGEPDNALEIFDAGFTNRLTAGFTNIQPSGKILTKADLCDPIFRAHGTNPAFGISIEDVVLRHSQKDLVLATYTEVQQGAQNTSPSTNARRSTVVFLRKREKLQWMHVHETALGMENN